MSLSTKRRIPSPSQSQGTTDESPSPLSTMKEMPVFGAPRKVERRDDRLSSFAMEVLGDFPQGRPPTNSDLGAIFTHTNAAKCTTAEASSVGEPSSHGSSAGSNDSVRGTEVASNGHSKKGDRSVSNGTKRSSANGSSSSSKASANPPASSAPKAPDTVTNVSASNGTASAEKRRRPVPLTQSSAKLFSITKSASSSPVIASKSLTAPRDSSVKKPKIIVGRGAGKNMSIHDKPESHSEPHTKPTKPHGKSSKARVKAIFEEMRKGKSLQTITRLANTPIKRTNIELDIGLLGETDLAKVTELPELSGGLSACKHPMALTQAKQRQLSALSSSSESDSDSDSSDSDSSSSDSDSDSDSSNSSSSSASDSSDSESEKEQEKEVAEVPSKAATNRGPEVPTTATVAPSSQTPPQTQAPPPVKPQPPKPVAIVQPHQSGAPPTAVPNSSTEPKQEIPEQKVELAEMLSPLLTQDAEDHLSFELVHSELTPMSLSYAVQNDPLALHLPDTAADDLLKSGPHDALFEPSLDPILGDVSKDALKLEMEEFIRKPLDLQTAASNLDLPVSASVVNSRENRKEDGSSNGPVESFVNGVDAHKTQNGLPFASVESCEPAKPSKDIVTPRVPAKVGIGKTIRANYDDEDDDDDEDGAVNGHDATVNVSDCTMSEHDATLTDDDKASVMESAAQLSSTPLHESEDQHALNADNSMECSVEMDISSDLEAAANSVVVKPEPTAPSVPVSAPTPMPSVNIEETSDTKSVQGGKSSTARSEKPEDQAANATAVSSKREPVSMQTSLHTSPAKRVKTDVRNHASPAKRTSSKKIGNSSEKSSLQQLSNGSVDRSDKCSTSDAGAKAAETQPTVVNDHLVLKSAKRKHSESAANADKSETGKSSGIDEPKRAEKGSVLVPAKPDETVITDGSVDSSSKEPTVVREPEDRDHGHEERDRERDRYDRDYYDRERDRDRYERDRYERDRYERDRYDRDRYARDRERDRDRDRERYDRDYYERDRERYERDRYDRDRERERYDSVDHWDSNRRRVSIDDPRANGERSRLSDNEDLKSKQKTPQRRVPGTLPVAAKEKRLRTFNDWLSEAKRLKHKADTINIRNLRAGVYLEAVVCFMKAGHILECTDSAEEKLRATRIYTDTLTLLHFINAVPEASKKGLGIWKVSNELGSIAYRCDAVLSFHAMRMLEEKMARHHKGLGDSLSQAGKTSSPAFSPAASINGVQDSSSSTTSHFKSPNSSGSNSSVPSPEDGRPACPPQLQSRIMHEGAAVCHDMRISLNMMRSWKQSEDLTAHCRVFHDDLERDSHKVSLSSPLPCLLEWAYMGVRRVCRPPKSSHR